jgi:integrase
MRQHFGARALRAITAAEIDAYPAHCRAVDEVGPSTIRKRLTILGTMFKMARRWGIVDANPAADVAKPGEPEHRTRYLEPAEWRKLAAEAASWLRPTMSIATGARLKEIVGLRWEDVDTARGFLTFTSGNKTARSRTIVIGKAIKAVLAGQRRAQVKAGRLGPWVFVDRHGSPYTSVRARNMIGQRTKAAMKAAGIKGASLHALRHTVGTWAAIDGRSESEIAKQLGHATTQTTRRYVNLLPEHLRQLAKGIDSRLVGSQMGHRSKKAGTRKAHK